MTTVTVHERRPHSASAAGGLRPRPHQQRAIDTLTEHFGRGESRAQLRMACGTGKTLVGAWLAQRLDGHTVVVFTPSIALVAQTRRAWQTSGLPLRSLAVCSNPTTAAGRAEIGVDGIDPFAGRHDVDGQVTTHAEVVAGFLDGAVDACSALTVIISTYHSAPVIAEALTLTDRCRVVDLIVADEAHHLAGRTDSRFLPVLGDRAIPARRRLFQTATPVVLANLASIDPLDELSGASDQIRSMNDARLFGPVVHTLTVGDSITAGLLADYRVVVTTPADPTPASAGAPERAALASLADVVGKYGVRRILTFHNRVAAARQFADRVAAMGAVNGVPIRGYAVDGAMPDVQRRKVLAALADSKGCITVVASSQCLREGIDVPAVDAVMFADPRTSPVGIIQAIGRALRPHQDKTAGTIVIPLVLQADGDDQEQLADSAYAHIWRVLRGLRAHDARVAFDVDRARVSLGKGSAGPDDLPWLNVFGDDPGTVIARLLERTSAAWEHYYGQLLAEVEKRGGSAAFVTTNGAGLGQWIAEQRIRYRQGRLDPERASRLQAVPGWQWESSLAADERSFATLQELVAPRGHLAKNQQGPSIFRGHTDGLGRPLAYWVAAQLCKYRDGTLDEGLAGRLTRLPGWQWDPLHADDSAAFDAYRSYVVWEGHTDVPTDHVEDDVALGEWLNTVRRRKALGTLHPLLEALLISAAPTGRNGERRFSWQTAQARWAIGMQAAQRHIERTGSMSGVSVGQTERVDGCDVDLYGWIVRIRHRYKAGKLAGDQAAAVQALPGWSWQGRHSAQRNVTIGEPLAAVREHGTPRGYGAGCRCLPCVDATRTYQRTAAAERRNDYRATNWIDAFVVRDHIRALLAVEAGTDRSDAVITVGAIAAAAGVPIGLIKKLNSDAPDPRCHPLHHRAILATTEHDVRAVRTIPRTRGRRGIAGHRETVDPAPTWRIVDALTEAGWSPQALTAALGYARATHLPFTREKVTAAQAKMVALLHESLDDDLAPPSVPPPRRRRNGSAHDASDGADQQWARDLLEQGYQPRRVAQRTGLSAGAVASLHAQLFGRAA